MTAYRRAFLWVLVAGVFTGIFLPSTGKCHTPTAAAKTLLWKVSGKGIKTSYLYGTFHLVPKADFALPAKVKKKMGKTRSVIFEVDLDSPTLTGSLSQAMRMNTPLETLMTPQEYSYLSKFVQDSLERSMQFFRYIKPAFLGQMLLYPKILGYNPQSYDLELLKLAKKNRKSIYSLETPQQQIALFEQSNLETQTNQLLYNVKHFDCQRKLMQQMLSLYQAEDIYGLYNLIAAEDGAEASQDLMLDSRNQKWVTPLVNKMKESTSFIAVGAAHLPGDNGLIELLRRQGYKVEPVYK